MNSVFDVSGLIEIATFEGAFDLLQAGVILVDHDCKIIHANRAARAMLEKGSPIRSVHGELKTPLHAPPTEGRAYGAPTLEDIANALRHFPRYKIDHDAAAIILRTGKGARGH